MPSILPNESVCRVGINGFGRIGRASFRASLDREDLLVVAINHTAPSLDYLLHVIRYDSTHGTCRHSQDLSIEDDHLVYKGRKITLFSQRDPTLIDWKSAGAEYIIESTGKFTTLEGARKHLHPNGGGKKVVISAPSKDPAVKTIVVGVNRKEYKTDMDVISNASCTTNCLAPLAKVLEQSFGIEYGMMTTVHASTSSQHILDGYSKKSRRLGRGVGSNIIPTSTGAATAVQLVLPELAGKFTGISIRVPVNNVSMVDLTVSLKTPVASKADLLFPLRQAAAGKSRYTIGPLNEVIAVDDNELVSSDFLGWKQSCIVDAAATVMLNPTTAKIIAFYDNEWAYSVRILDLLAYMHRKDSGAPSLAPSGRSSPVPNQ
ncbi:putative glyceraldehyde 3-phosphate dehydrogenase [Leucosporidium creatinivorum]|uniref:Putative glyceraldehyde 3-phosphate dehydrogenase n=1 Tax=Leucosporidium creatinivorum TaxID=106004 RepID=A0A1Y2FY07_9BASI|nr:putative glyceraldehyde 3-phosphate dehydrogenase [Leucosporidium creatinivorum]